MLRVASLCVALAVVLSACGSSEGDRAASGAGIGAAGGAVVGGATGYLTDEETIDLGDPVWEDDDSAGGQSGTVTRVQGGLAQLGYSPGPVDGVMGPQTAEAIRDYQRDHGLLIDGRPTAQLADHIEQRI
jgi:peptidoglycan hydrolase-like protein with peptidoglycan-binding domain